MTGEELETFDGEVVDGEVVADGSDAKSFRPRGMDGPGRDFRWEQWRSSPVEGRGRETTVFKIEVDENWYKRVDRQAVAELNAVLLEIRRLGRL